MTSCGMPMSAITTSPACASPGGRTSGSFGAASVTVIDASMQSPIRCGVSADSPLGRSIDTIGMADALTSATTVSIMPPSAAFSPVPKIASTISVHCGDLREVQLPALLVVDLDDGDAEPAEDLEIRLRVAAHVGERADDEHRRVDAALQQRPGDDEAVAAVVAAAAQHRHAPVEPRLVGRLHRRHDLAAGVLHQHQRRDADVFDREAIGLAHLRGVEDSHSGGIY